MPGIACTICTAVAPDAGPHRAHVRHELTLRPDLVRRFPGRNPQNHRSTYLATLKIRNREPRQDAHTVLRRPSADFGADILAAHYREAGEHQR